MSLENMTIEQLQKLMLSRKGEGRGRGRTIELTENDKKVILKYVRGLLTNDFVSAKYISRETGVPIPTVTRAVARCNPPTQKNGKPNKLHSPLFVSFAELSAKEILAELKAKADADAKANKSKGK